MPCDCKLYWFGTGSYNVFVWAENDDVFLAKLVSIHPYTSAIVIMDGRRWVKTVNSQHSADRGSHSYHKLNVLEPDFSEVHQYQAGEFQAGAW